MLESSQEGKIEKYPERELACQTLLTTIGEALLAHMDGKSCTWGEAAEIIDKHATPDQKKEYFGNPKFSISKAKKYLSEYVTITGTGDEVVVEPVPK